MAELTAVITYTDVTDRLATSAYQRLYAKNGGSTVDTSFRDVCVAEANSTFRVLTRAAFPDGVYSTTDTRDPAVVGWIVDLCNGIAYSRGASYDPDGGYAVKAREARANVKLMNRDADARAPGSSAVRPVPRAVNNNINDAAGTPTNSYTRAADRRDGSDF